MVSGPLILLSGGLAWGQAVGVHAMTGAIAPSPIGVRPGVRLSYEPAPSASLDLMGAAGLEPFAQGGLGPGWEWGLGLTGRLWITEPRDGLFVLGRTNVGLAGEPDGRVGPWFGGYAGFGGRVNGVVNIEAAIGPEWSAHDPAGWRTELSIGVMFDAENDRRRGRTRHRPGKPPRE